MGPEAVAVLRRFVERHPDHGEATRGRFMLAQALEASGAPADAAGLYRLIWIRAPASPFADPAGTAERALAARGVSLAPPTPRERLERADRLLAGGRADTARAEAEVLASEGLEPEPKLRALKIVAEASRRTGKHDVAARAIDQALAIAGGPARATWLLERARLQQRQNRDGALAVLRQIVQEHPKAPEAAEALALSARLLEEAGRGPEAEQAYLRVAAEYADDGEAGAALWRLGWIAWQRGSPADAAERWGRVLKVRGGQAYRDPATYWIGRAHEARGEREAAERQYAALAGEAARTYYGVLASARLAGRPPAASPSPARPAPARPALSFPADPVEPLRTDPVYVRVDALRAVGLVEFVQGEVDVLARRAAGDPLRLYSVAAVHVEDARYHLAIRMLRRAFFQEARAGDAALPRSFWEMLYPLGWRSRARGGRRARHRRPLAGGRGGARGVLLPPEGALPRGGARAHAAHAGHRPAHGAPARARVPRRGRARRSGGQPRHGRLVPGGPGSPVRRAAARRGRLQRRPRPRAPAAPGGALRRHGGVGGDGPVRRDARLRQARDALVGRPSAPPRPASVIEVWPAGFWRRLGAWWADRLIGLGVWALCAMWLVLGLWTARGLPRDLPGPAVLAAALLLLEARSTSRTRSPSSADAARRPAR